MEKPIEEGAEFKHAGRQGGRDGGGLLRLDDVTRGTHINDLTVEQLEFLVLRLRGEVPNTITTLQVPPRP